MEEKIPLVAVVGPTASGKTSLAVDLALAMGGEVVSADSMQIYRHMDIGTAKPTAEEMRGVPHHLIDVADPAEDFSVARYVALAAAAVRDIHARGKVPIVCGGTGLYIDTLLNNTALGGERSDPVYRAELISLGEREGGAALKRLLYRVDPQSAGEIPDGNLRRLARALEIHRTTGIPKAEWVRRSRAVPSPYDPFYIGLNYRDRSALYARINRRVDDMFARGLADEAAGLLSRGVPENATAMQAIGYKETIRALRGECTFEEASSVVKQSTRRYAKRQITWFSANPRVRFIYPDAADGEIRPIWEEMLFRRGFL